MSWVFPRKVYHPATSRNTIPPLAPRRNSAKLPPAAAASRPFRDTMPRGDGAEAETPQDALAALSARLRECGELGDAVGFRTTLEAFNDEHDEYRKHSWLRLPPGSSLTPQGQESCELYIKEGGFPYLRSA